MNLVKTDEEVERMIKAGEILRSVYHEITGDIKSGVSTLEIDNKIIDLIKKSGGEISFQTVKGYRWASCACINEQIVHTTPSDRILEEGDVFTLDFGVLYKGYHVDFADTLIIRSHDEKKTAFLEAGKKTLEVAINSAVEGNLIRDISKCIYESISKSGYKVIRGLTGHGIGKSLHEKPLIPGYPENDPDSRIVLQKNMTFAIEVIYSESAEQYRHENDWSIVTEDGSLSACFEHTVLVDKTPRILT